MRSARLRPRASRPQAERTAAPVIRMSSSAAPAAHRALTRAALLGGVWLGAFAALCPVPAQAVDGTWTGPGAEWTTGTNWSSSPTVPDNIATFTNNPGAPTSITIGNDASINTMQFDAAAPPYSFTINNGVTFSINGIGIDNSSATTPSLVNNGRLIFDPPMFTTTNAAIDISGTGGLSKSGAGALVLSGNNSYAGSTDIGGVH